MKIRTAPLLIPVLLALCVGTAVAKPPPKQLAKLDPSYGRGGVAKTATALKETEVLMAVAPGGKTYVVQGLTVLGFGADGKPNREFGENGRVELFGVAAGTVQATAITVSNGTVWVTGWIDKPNPVAWVISLNPDGTRNRGFGVSGEVQTGFLIPPPTDAAGMPQPSQARYEPTSIFVDAQGRPVVGGRTVSTTTTPAGCWLDIIEPAAFVARLTPSGLTDTSFAGRGYTILGPGSASAVALAPNGELAALDNLHTGCHEHEPSSFSTDRLTEAGLASPLLDPARPSFTMRPLLVVDQEGRLLVVQTVEASESPGTVVRLLPTGFVDTTFGHEGGAPLTGLLSWAAGLAVDAKGRPLVVGGRGGVEILRLQADGKRDSSFGPKGMFKGGAAGNSEGAVGAIGLDQRGRIYVAGWVQSKSLKTGYGVQVTRILPGS
jgi:uncharacterized delta-60 repeat protein